MSTTDATPQPTAYPPDMTNGAARPPRTAGPSAVETPRPSAKTRILLLVEAYAVPALFVLVMLFFGTWGKTRLTFLTIDNIQNVLANQAIVGILALALIIPKVAGEFDFSVGPIHNFTQMYVAGFMAWGIFGLDVPWPVAIVAVVLLSAFVGFLTGDTVARIGVNSLIVTLGLGNVLLGLVQLYTGNQAIIQGLDKSVTSLGGKSLLNIPVVFYFLVAVAVLVWYLLEHTPYGRYLQSIGSNRDAARLVGLPVQKYVTLAFVLSGTLAGIAGVLLLARNGTGNPLPDGGITQSLQALAAAYLGATCIKPGRFNVVGTLVAVFFLAFTASGLILAGVAPWINPVFSGAALFVAVLISKIVASKRAATG